VGPRLEVGPGPLVALVVDQSCLCPRLYSHMNDNKVRHFYRGRPSDQHGASPLKRYNSSLTMADLG